MASCHGLWTGGSPGEVPSPMPPGHPQSSGLWCHASFFPSPISQTPAVALPSPLQVIVMSGHETIRVLEVGVDAQLPAEEEGKGLEGAAAEGSQSGDPAEAHEPAGEAGPGHPKAPAEATGRRPLLPSGVAALRPPCGLLGSQLVATGHPVFPL